MASGHRFEECLGHDVDAWLAELRAQGLSTQRLSTLAQRLGAAHSGKGSGTQEERTVAERFEEWRGTRCHDPEAVER